MSKGPGITKMFEEEQGDSLFETSWTLYPEAIVIRTLWFKTELTQEQGQNK